MSRTLATPTNIDNVPPVAQDVPAVCIVTVTAPVDQYFDLNELVDELAKIQPVGLGQLLDIAVTIEAVTR